MNKRSFLKAITTLSIGNGANLLLPGTANSAIPTEYSFDQTFWLRPRRLHIFRSDRQERLNLTYYNQGSYDAQIYKQFCWLFRDIKSKDSAQYIDIALLNLLFGIQEWARQIGSYDPVYTLNSGYRTNARNRTIEGAAKNSMHVLGKAADGTFKTISLNNTIQMATYFGAGGVGAYSTFIHLDTSRFRKWSGVRK